MSRTLTSQTVTRRQAARVQRSAMSCSVQSVRKRAASWLPTRSGLHWSRYARQRASGGRSGLSCTGRIRRQWIIIFLRIIRRKHRGIYLLPERSDQEPKFYLEFNGNKCLQESVVCSNVEGIENILKGITNHERKGTY